jgi:hypothetical protein
MRKILTKNVKSYYNSLRYLRVYYCHINTEALRKNLCFCVSVAIEIKIEFIATSFSLEQIK